VAIQYIGSATGVTSATLPAHQAGDLILAFAFRDGITTAPTLPSGWTNIRNNSGNACSGRVAYRVATASGTASGTWTNATSVVFLIYRNINQNSPIGNTNSATDSSVTVNYPALPVSQNSWVVGFAGHSSANVNLIAPTGMTNRAYVQDATDEAAGHDTNGSVASWASRNTSVGGTSGGWRSYVLEIKPSVSVSTTIESIEISSAIQSISSQGNALGNLSNISIIDSSNGEFYQTSNNWYSWFFDRSYILISFGNAETSVSGISLPLNIAEIEAFVSTNATVIIAGIQSTSSFQSVSALGSAQVLAESMELDTQVSELSSSGDAQFELDGNNLELTIGNVFGLGSAQASTESIQLDTLVSEVSGSGSAESQLDGNSLDLAIGDVFGLGQAQASAESIQLDTQFSEVFGIGDAKSELSGIIIELTIGEVTATAATSVDASVEITGVLLGSAVGNVSASAISAEILQLSGNPRRYSATQFKNNVVKIQGIGAKITTGTVSALGVISISGTAVLQNVGLYSEVQTVSAEGILSISEDELILLLAA